jgi:hypothetical protein
MKLIIITIVMPLVIALTVSSAFAHKWCWTCTQSNTYGWQLMTPDERKAHQAKLVSFTEFNACKEYIDKHHKKMEERARERGVDLPAVQEDPCDTMKAEDILK